METVVEYLENGLLLMVDENGNYNLKNKSGYVGDHWFNKIEKCKGCFRCLNSKINSLWFYIDLFGNYINNEGYSYCSKPVDGYTIISDSHGYILQKDFKPISEYYSLISTNSLEGLSSKFSKGEEYLPIIGSSGRNLINCKGELILDKWVSDIFSTKVGEDVVFLIINGKGNYNTRVNTSDYLFKNWQPFIELVCSGFNEKRPPFFMFCIRLYNGNKTYADKNGKFLLKNEDMFELVKDKVCTWNSKKSTFCEKVINSVNKFRFYVGIEGELYASEWFDFIYDDIECSGKITILDNYIYIRTLNKGKYKKIIKLKKYERV